MPLELYLQSKYPKQCWESSHFDTLNSHLPSFRSAKTKVQFERPIARHHHPTYSRSHRIGRDYSGGSKSENYYLTLRFSSTLSDLLRNISKSFPLFFLVLWWLSLKKLMLCFLSWVQQVFVPRFSHLVLGFWFLQVRPINHFVCFWNRARWPEPFHRHFSSIAYIKVTRDAVLENWDFPEPAVNVSREFGSGYPGGLSDCLSGSLWTRGLYYYCHPTIVRIKSSLTFFAQKWAAASS